MNIKRGECKTEYELGNEQVHWKECWRTISAWQNLGSGGRFQKGKLSRNPTPYSIQRCSQKNGGLTRMVFIR